MYSLYREVSLRKQKTHLQNQQKLEMRSHLPSNPGDLPEHSSEASSPHFSLGFLMIYA